MIKTITQDEIVKYIYNETSAEENQQIENVMTWDSELKEEINEMLFLKKEIKKIELKPSDRLTENLLFFSKHFNS